MSNYAVYSEAGYEALFVELKATTEEAALAEAGLYVAAHCDDARYQPGSYTLVHVVCELDVSAFEEAHTSLMAEKARDRAEIQRLQKKWRGGCFGHE